MKGQLLCVCLGIIPFAQMREGEGFRAFIINEVNRIGGKLSEGDIAQKADRGVMTAQRQRAEPSAIEAAAVRPDRMPCNQRAPRLVKSSKKNEIKMVVSVHIQAIVILPESTAT